MHTWTYKKLVFNVPKSILQMRQLKVLNEACQSNLPLSSVLKRYCKDYIWYC